MRTLIFIISSCIAFEASAQSPAGPKPLNEILPMAGIYKTTAPLEYSNELPLQPYLSTINNGGLEVNIRPHAQVRDSRIRYAIVAIDSSARLLTLAFLQDNVTRWARSRIAPDDTLPVREDRYSRRFIYGDSLTGNSETSLYDFAVEGHTLFSRDHFTIYRELDVRHERYQDTISGAYVTRNIYTFELQAFSQDFAAPAYETVRFTNQAIPVYKAPDRKSQELTRFLAGEYIAVRSGKNPLWYEVDRLEIQPDTAVYYDDLPEARFTRTKLKITSGWISVEDLAPGPWIRQDTATHLYRFDAAGYAPGQDDPAAGSGQLDAIRVVNRRTGKTQQVILDIGAMLTSPLHSALRLEDANFDGWPDIVTFSQNGGAGPNYSNNYYLYNPSARRFVYDSLLSGFSQPVIDPVKKTVTSSWRAGAGMHGAETYAYINGKLTRTRFWEQVLGNGYFASERTGQLINGQWEEKTQPGGEMTVPALTIYDKENGRPIDTVSREQESFPYFLIQNETPLWFHVSYGEKAVHTGWIRKEGLLPVTWMPRTAETPQYRFEASGDGEMIAAVRVISKANGAPVQVIVVEGGSMADSLFTTGDYNGDGYTDFRIGSSEGNQAVVYYYDSSSRLFRKGEEAPAKNDR